MYKFHLHYTCRTLRIYLNCKLQVPRPPLPAPAMTVVDGGGWEQGRFGFYRHSPLSDVTLVLPIQDILGPPDIPTYVPFSCDENGAKNPHTFDFCADVRSKNAEEARFLCTKMDFVQGDVVFLCGRKPAGRRSSQRESGRCWDMM